MLATGFPMQKLPRSTSGERRAVLGAWTTANTSHRDFAQLLRRMRSLYIGLLAPNCPAHISSLKRSTCKPTNKHDHDEKHIRPRSSLRSPCLYVRTRNLKSPSENHHLIMVVAGDRST
jgi:hypothetical protein